MNEELRYVLVGALISIPLSILSPFGTELVKQYAAKRSSAAKARRVVELKANLAKIEEWNANRSTFHTYLITRLVLVFLIENLVGALTSAIGASGNSIWATWRASDRLTEDQLVATDWAYAAAEALWFVGCIIMFRILYTAYRNYRKVRDIDETRRKVDSQITSFPGASESQRAESSQ
ncbi:hypothetical protein [Micromonospora sp. NPDC000729]|uniref:hypothetical protein n=1 Tax=Micromonospora sp. NPDC000729 TaxID=3364220 RepID=UPI00369AB43E